MPAEKRDDQTAADNENTGFARSAPPTRCFPSRSRAGQRSALFPERNPVRRADANNLERSSEFAFRLACHFFLPTRKQASRNRATRGVQREVAPPARWGVCIAAGPGVSEPDPRSPGEC